MKLIPLFSLCAFASATLSASIIVQETFNYSTGVIGSTAANGTGMAGDYGSYSAGWNNLPAGTADATILAGSLLAPTSSIGGFNVSNNRLAADISDFNDNTYFGFNSGIDFGTNSTHYLGYLGRFHNNGSVTNTIRFLDGSDDTVKFTVGELDSTTGELSIVAGATTVTTIDKLDEGSANAFGTDNLIVLKIQTSSTGNDTISASFWTSGIDTVSAEPTTWDISTTIDLNGTLSIGHVLLTDGFADLDSSIDEFTIGTSFTDVIATTTAVPEPSTYAAFFGIFALGLVVYRKRKQ